MTCIISHFKKKKKKCTAQTVKPTYKKRFIVILVKTIRAILADVLVHRPILNLTIMNPFKSLNSS